MLAATPVRFVVGTEAQAGYDVSRLRLGIGTTNRAVKANDAC